VIGILFGVFHLWYNLRQQLEESITADILFSERLLILDQLVLVMNTPLSYAIHLSAQSALQVFEDLTLGSHGGFASLQFLKGRHKLVREVHFLKEAEL